LGYSQLSLRDKETKHLTGTNKYLRLSISASVPETLNGTVKMGPPQVMAKLDLCM
jgi:hypothetical protein